MTEEIDCNEAQKALHAGQAISDKDGVLAPLVKRFTEAALEAEPDSHLADDIVPNRKNDKSDKSIKSQCKQDRSGHTPRPSWPGTNYF